jgi:hypothetical protein
MTEGQKSTLNPSLEERRGISTIDYGNVAFDNDFCLGGVLWEFCEYGSLSNCCSI